MYALVAAALAHVEIAAVRRAAGWCEIAVARTQVCGLALAGRRPLERVQLAAREAKIRIRGVVRVGRERSKPRSQRRLPRLPGDSVCGHRLPPGEETAKMLRAAGYRVEKVIDGEDRYFIRAVKAAAQE